jgi:hypothetical protein
MVAGIYKPGTTSIIYLDTQAPAPGVTDVQVTQAHAEEFSLRTDPNPFADQTRVSFAMPARGAARIVVLDVTGRQVRTLFDGVANEGSNAIQWDGRDDHGVEVVSGVYFFRIESQNAARTIKGTLLR